MDFISLLNPVFITAGMLYLILAAIFFYLTTFKKTDETKVLKLTKVLVLFFAVFYTLSSGTRFLGMDEMEHIQSAWLVSTGDIPYVDFFQHHHGLIWYIFSGVFHIFGESVFSIIVIRLLNLSFVFGILYLVYRISLEITNSAKTAFFTLSIAFSINIFVRNAAYIRPDVFMTLLIFLSFFLFLKFLKNKKNLFLVWSGISLAFSFFALQKAAFYILPFFVLVAFFLFTKRIKIRSVLILSFSALIPLILFLGIYWASGLFKEYITFNWIYNFLKPAKNPITKLFLKPTDYIVCANFVLLFLFSLYYFIRKNRKNPLFIVVSFFIGLAGLGFYSILPTVYIYYFIWVIPFLMIPAGYFVVQFFDTNKVKYNLQLLFLVSLFIFTVPMLSKRIHSMSLFQQMKVNREVLNDLQSTDKILTCWPGILYSKNAHYLFFQTDAKVNDKLVLKTIVDHKKYKKWITSNMKVDANYNPQELIENENPRYIYATQIFINSWDLEDILNNDYKFTGHKNLYKRANDK